MELLYELESQADEIIVEWIRRTIADALITKYGERCRRMSRYFAAATVARWPAAWM